VSFVAGRGVAGDAYTAIGFPVFAGRAVRADVVRRVAEAEARRKAEPTAADASADPDADARADARMASWMGCSTREGRRVMAAMRQHPTQA
jgi:hypothetical protein